MTSCNSNTTNSISTSTLLNEISWNVGSGITNIQLIGSAQLTQTGSALRITSSNNGLYGIQIKSRLYCKKNDRLRLKIQGKRNFQASNSQEALTRHPHIFIASSELGTISPTDTYLMSTSNEVTENITISKDAEILWGVRAQNGKIGDIFELNYVIISHFSTFVDLSDRRTVTCNNCGKCPKCRIIMPSNYGFPLYFIPGSNLPLSIYQPQQQPIIISGTTGSSCGTNTNTNTNTTCGTNTNTNTNTTCGTNTNNTNQTYDNIYEQLYASPCVVAVYPSNIDMRYTDYFKVLNAFPSLDIDIGSITSFTKLSIQSSALTSQERNPFLEVGRIFLGQFIANDISYLDFSADNITSPDIVEAINQETPQLDLRTVYGGSNLLSNPLYANVVVKSGLFVYNQLDNDLLRVSGNGLYLASGIDGIVSLVNTENLFSGLSVGEALVPDRRSDNNLVLAQMHLVWQKFHNYVFRKYRELTPYNNLPIEQLFIFVQRQVRFYYQWIIVNDFLPYFVDNDILDAIFSTGRTRVYDFKKAGGKVPFEFILGSLKVLDFVIPDTMLYGLDSNNSTRSLNYSQLTVFTKGNLPTLTSVVSGTETINPRNILKIDWNQFFKIQTTAQPIKAKKFNTNILATVDNIFDNYGEITMLNSSTYVTIDDKLSRMLTHLYRGYQVDLESAQNAAKEIGLTPISTNLIKNYITKSGIASLAISTPLLLYMLIESQILKRGEMLTGIGGLMMAEVIYSILKNDPLSYFNSAEEWKPGFPVLSITEKDITIEKIIELSNDPLANSG